MPPLPDIAISTSAYADQPLAPTLERIAELAPAAEIRSFGMHNLLAKHNLAAARAAGLSYTVHGPFGATSLGDASERVRTQLLDEHHRQLAAAAEVGARLYVVHPDWSAERVPRDPKVVTALEGSFRTLAEWQTEYDVDIVVENMPGAGSSHFTHPGDLDLQGLGLILDVGHANISGCLHDWLAEPRTPIRHLHLHDNAGVGDRGDPHGSLGTGVVDVAAVVAAARAAGASMVLENYNEAAVLGSLARLRELELI